MALLLGILDMFSPFYLLLVIPFSFLFIKSLFSKKVHNLPPGPRPWPLIGNIHQVGQKPHVSLARFAESHGPLISLRLGNQLLVVASSPAAAVDILKTQDRLLSSRYVPNAFDLTFPNFYSLIWAFDCNEDWRALRTLCRTELFSPKAIESQSSLREQKINQMVEFLGSKQGEAVKIAEVVFTTVFNTLSSTIFSKDFLDLRDEEGTAGGLKGKLFKILSAAVTPNIGDFYPLLATLDLQGLRKQSMKNMKEVFQVWEVIIKERREKKDDGSPEKQSFLDRMLASGFTNDQISVLALELFTAGTDTTTSTTEWAMAELLKNEAAMSKVREEISREITSNHITESQLSKLSYLQACIKETLRLHPPAPFLLPHRALETCEVMNYTIPRNSQIFVNVWAIGRDPKIWEAPTSFRPERFLELNLDFKGQDYEFIPFGAGRRMCPGMPAASKQVQYMLASLLHRFDWSLPNDEDPMKLDMNENFGVTLQKEKPLMVILKQR